MKTELSRAFLITCFTSTLLTLTGCNLGIHKDDETVSLQVDSYKPQCDENSASLCFRIRDDEDDDWRIWNDGPFEDFDSYEWGYVYTIEAVVSYQSGGGAPASYRWQSTTSKETVTGSDQYFTLDLHTDTGVLAQITETTWNLGSEIDFPCEEECDDLSAVVSEQQIGSFEYRADEGDLTLTGVLCSTGDNDEFSDNCSGKSSENWFIAQFLSDCGFTEPALCLLYRTNESDPFELLPLEDGIDDFSLSWGTRYDLDVIKTVSGGGNLTEAELASEDSSAAAIGSAWSFLMVVRGEGLDASTDGVIDLYDSNISLDCSQYALCGSLDNRINEDQYLLLEAYVESSTVVVVTDIVCDDENYGSFSACVDEQDADDDFNWPI